MHYTKIDKNITRPLRYWNVIVNGEGVSIYFVFICSLFRTPFQ